MRAEDLVCWKCGTSLAGEPLPLSRYAECRECRAELHVCRMCEFFDRHVPQNCREPMADEVKDKKRANFCGYFQPRPDAYEAVDDAAERAARQALESLFSGGDAGEERKGPNPLDELFDPGEKK